MPADLLHADAPPGGAPPAEALPDDPRDTRMPAPRGQYRDVLHGPDGRLVWDRGWAKNAILTDCRRLLAAFMRGGGALGIQGLAVGSGLAAWDAVPPPAPVGNEVALVDPNPFLVPPAALAFSFLAGNVPSVAPTNRLQVVVSIGPGLPPWPDASHPAANLREFGLVAQLGGANVLVNMVRHPVIAKDPLSTLTRTIWLVF